ncbi:MAG: ATP-binding protein [Bacteroidota bacterium]
MDQLIEDLLAFSRLGRKELVKEEINMKDLVENIINDLKSSQKQEHSIDIKVGGIENSFGDPILLKQVWVNLISNAIKYSMKKPKTEIEIGSKTNDKEVTYWVKDNGAGFNIKYVDKLFKSFSAIAYPK